MAKDITLKTRNGETRYPKSVTALIYENGTGKTLQTIIDEMRQVDAATNTRTQHFKADVNNLDTLKNKTNIGLYNYVGNGWRGSVSVCYDSADNVSQVALSSSTPSYNGNTLTWLSAQPCAMARTYTNGAWSHWEKVGAPVVNDLTTGGTDKALSAEMGKTLKEGLDALGPKIDEINKDVFGSVLALNETSALTAGTLAMPAFDVVVPANEPFEVYVDDPDSILTNSAFTIQSFWESQGSVVYKEAIVSNARVKTTYKLTLSYEMRRLRLYINGSSISGNGNINVKLTIIKEDSIKGRIDNIEPVVANIQTNVVPKIGVLENVIVGGYDSSAISNPTLSDGCVYGSTRSVGSKYTAGTTDSNSNGKYNATPIDVSQYDKVVVSSNSAGNRAIILTNENDYIVAINRWENLDGSVEFEVSQLGGTKLYVCVSNAQSTLEIIGFTKVEGLEERVAESEQSVAEMSQNVTEMSSIINGSETPTDITNLAILSSGIVWGSNKSIGQKYTGGNDGDTSQYTPSPISVTGYDKVLVTSNSTGNRAIILTDAEDYIVGLGQWGNLSGSVEFDVKSLGGAKLYVCINANDGTTLQIVGYEIVDGIDKRFENIEKGLKDGSKYVSANGSDSNDGSRATPYASIQKAIDEGASRIFIFGGVYQESIDLSKYTNKELTISKYEKHQSVTISGATTTLATSDGTLVSGTTKVYKLSGISLPQNCSFIFQEGVPYGLIQDDERMPQQRGMQYRLADTPIKKMKTSVTSVETAISTIDADERYLYYLDGTDLYYSRPNTLSSSNPLITASVSNSGLFSNIPKGLKLNCYGINTKYLVFNINGTFGSHIEDCRSVFAFGSGGFQYDTCLSSEFINCEAAGAYFNTNGDGFNGHSTGDPDYMTGDAFAKTTTCRLVNCWSHDNNDDGYSDHERSETLIEGGLFEYNGKGGIVPSYGSHCVCYNVVSRNNCNGFFCCGTPELSEGGVGTQLECFNCLAINNTNAYGLNWQTGNAEQNAGFVCVNAACTIIAYNCVSIGNKDGYGSLNTTGVLMLTDCKASGNSNQDWFPKSAQDAAQRVVIRNTTAISY